MLSVPMNVFNGPQYDLHLYYMSLKRMCTLLLLDGIFYRYKLGQIGCVVQVFYIFTKFFLLVLPIAERKLLKSPTIVVYFSFSPFSSVSFYHLF